MGIILGFKGKNFPGFTPLPGGLYKKRGEARPFQAINYTQWRCDHKTVEQYTWTIKRTSSNLIPFKRGDISIVNFLRHYSVN